jgi:hypothetical protein
VSYLIGARHTLVGSGQVALASPIGLKLQVPNVPISVDERFGSPMQIYGAGWITLGNADGWFEVIPLRHQAQLEVGFDPVPTQLGYDLVAGVTLIADELVAGTPAVRGLFERNPAAAGQSVLAWNPANQPQTSPIVYAVPAGRKLYLTSLRLTLSRVGNMPASSVNVARCYAQIDGLSVIADVQISAPTLYATDVVQGPVILNAGQVLRCYYYNTETGGATYATLSWAGTLVDA